MKRLSDIFFTALAILFIAGYVAFVVLMIIKRAYWHIPTAMIPVAFYFMAKNAGQPEEVDEDEQTPEEQ